LVARPGPIRDALLERLRDGLGETYYVPTPTRAPEAGTSEIRTPIAAART